MWKNKRNFCILAFLLSNLIMLFSWAILLFWWAKYEFFFDPFTYIPAGIIIGAIIFVSCYFLIRGTIKVLKNLKERIQFTKRSVIATIIASFIFTSFSIFAIFLAFVPSASFYYEYDNGPYLIWNSDPKTSMTIIWITANPSKTEFLYGTHINDMTMVKGKYTRRHIIKLNNLESETMYYYQIPGFSGNTYNFTTAPLSGNAFNFTVVGDNRNNGGSSLSNYGSVINAMRPFQYEFIINVGDVCYDGRDFNSWHEFFDNMEKHASNHPYMISIGNHEYGDDLFAVNFKYFFPYDYSNINGHYYSFDYSNAHFLMIDNFDNPLSGGHYVTETQLAWIKKDLAANQDKWLFVAFHVPVYSTGDYNMDQILINQLASIFYDYKVDVVLTGHDHHYEAFWVNQTEDWGGTYYFISGGGGASLDLGIMERSVNPWRELYHNASLDPYQFDYVTLHNQIYGELIYQFMHFEINGDNLNIQSIRENGTLIHEISLVK